MPPIIYFTLNEKYMVGDMFSDAGFVGALVGAISGIFGAVFGGAMTYYASKQQYHTEHQTKQNAALGACLIEICRNQAGLIRELDRVLPLWLSRRYDSDPLSHILKEATSPIPKFDTRIYSSFFTELLSSPYGSELKTYYDRVETINAFSEGFPEGLPSKFFFQYVQVLALAVEVTYDIADALQKVTETEMPQKWGKEKDYQNLNLFKERALLMAALFRTKLSDLESFLAGEHTTAGFPELVTKCDKVSLAPWLIQAQDFFRKSL